jgi:SAM-dependent methyltransferase
LERVRDGRPVTSPRFFVADVNDVELAQGAYDVVTCCGSVLSFLNDPLTALQRMAATVRPGGLLFLEVEQKANADLLWPAIDRLLLGRLHYEQDWRTILANLLRRWGSSIRIDYPFELRDGRELVLPLRLFAVKELRQWFTACGLHVTARAGIHWATGIVPSTVLHRSDASEPLTRVVHALFAADQALAGAWPCWRFGCSVIFCLERRP